MGVVVSKNEGTEAVAHRTARMALILSFMIFGAAVAYFGGLFLITH